MKTTLLQKQNKVNIFLGMLISADMFWGMADIPDIFFEEGKGEGDMAKYRIFCSRQNSEYHSPYPWG